MAKLAAALTVGLLVLAVGPSRWMFAEQSEDDWKKAGSSRTADPEEDDWKPRKPTVSPAGGQLPQPAELPAPRKPVDELPPPAPKKLPDELPLPKGGGPELPVPRPIGKGEPRTLPEPKTALPPPSEAGTTNIERSILLSAARNAVKQRDWPSAIARFEEAFRRFGEDAELRSEFAGVLVQASRVRDALASYRMAVQLRPDDPRIRVRFGDVALLARDYPTAISQFHRAVELRPDDAEYAIRLSRAHIFDGAPDRGQAVYDRLLTRFRADDDDVPPGLPNLLVDLRRPVEALAFLKPMRAAKPNDPELAAASIRARAMAGDRSAAAMELDAFWAASPEAKGLRRELAEALFGSDDHDLAVIAYEHLLRGEPENPLYLAGLARAQVSLFNTSAARLLLEPLKPTPESARTIHHAMAEYHLAVGEWAECREQYRLLLDLDREDDEARIGLGNLYERAREDEKAKAEYSKVPSTSGRGRRARLAIVQVLVNQRRFAEAADLCKQLLATHAEDASAVGQLIRTLAKWGKADEAAALGRGYLHNQPRNESGQTSVRIALGRALIEGGKAQEAARTLDQAIQRVGGQMPEAFYNLSRAFALSGDGPRSDHAIAMCLGLGHAQTRHRILLAELQVGDFQDPPAAALLGEVIAGDPNNLPALIRLAEVQARLARETGEPAASVATATDALAQAPTDARAKLALARGHAVGSDWKESTSTYEQMLATVPDFFVPQRELARTLYSSSDFNAGASAYQRIQSPPADHELHAALGEIAQRDPRVALLLGPALVAPAPGRVLRAEVNKAVASLVDAEMSDRVAQAFLDFEARTNEQMLAKLEGVVKANSWRAYDTIANAKTLLEVDPSNTSVRFDLGQAYSTLKQSKAAIGTYTELLGINPLERESKIAIERAGLEMQPQLHLATEGFAQRGRTSLSEIARFRVAGLARIPFDDEEEFVDVGYAHMRFRPADDSDLLGSILTLRGQAKHHEKLLGFATLNLETYESRFDTRATGEIGLRYDAGDDVRMRGALFLENVVENGETLRQDIHRYGMRLAADYKPARRWLATGRYTVAHYSDDNDYHDLFLTAEYTMLFAPTQLRALLIADVYGYREGTVLRTADQNNLFGANHPYFTPNLFGYTEARIEWTHWLSRDYFAHSNQAYYQLQAGVGFDTGAVRYQTARAILYYDVKPWLTLSMDASATLSSAYESAGVSLQAIFRFPGIR